MATGRGVFANDALPTDANHVQGEMTNNVSGSAFVPGVTNFTTEAFLDTLTTMGDSEGALGIVMVHSIVFNRMRKNNLIDYIPDSEGRVNIPTFLGKRVIVDDGMPNQDGVYDTWIFGAGAFRFGNGLAPVPVAVERDESSGHGGGQKSSTTVSSGACTCAGYAWVGDTTCTAGGLSNAATAGNIGMAAASCKRGLPGTQADQDGSHGDTRSLADKGRRLQGRSAEGVRRRERSASFSLIEDDHMKERVRNSRHRGKVHMDNFRMRYLRYFLGVGQRTGRTHRCEYRHDLRTSAAQVRRLKPSKALRLSHPLWSPRPPWQVPARLAKR
ncbi:major capsid protein [Stenotrophomonas phage CM2]